MRILSISLMFVALLLCVGLAGRTATLPGTPGVVYDTPEAQPRYAPLQSCLFMEATTSVPFAGLTTPSGIQIFTSPDNPPAGFEAGELYLHVSTERGWEKK